MKIKSILTIVLLLIQHSFTHGDPLELTVTTHLGAGFFCEFLKVVDNILHFEDEQLNAVTIDWAYEFFPYKNGPYENGWPLYFEPIQITQNNDNDNAPTRKVTAGSFNHELHDQLCRDTWVLYDKYLPYRQMAHQVIKKYIQFKDHIMQEVENFYEQYMADHICIGVHVRFAGAHAHEVPGGRHPSLESYMDEINSLIKKHSDSSIKIFLATDSHLVINHFKNHYPTSMLLYIDAFRASDALDPHLIYENSQYWLSHPAEFHQKKPGYFGGKTTLLDGLLLSRCDYLIHTTSNVSTFASFMNPYIKSIYLPKNISPLPCHEKNTPREKNIKNRWHLHLS